MVMTRGCAVVGGSVFDGESDAFQGDMAVIIEGGRFTRIAPRASVEIPPELPVIDATGKFVLPGLINAHAHLTFMYRVGATSRNAERTVTDLTIHAVRVAALLLAQGITTVREMGGESGVPLEMRRAIQAGIVPGPRVVACGQPICVTGGHAAHLSVEADGADGFRRAARGQLKAGADFVKVMASNDPWPMPGVEQTRADAKVEEIQAAFDEAHEWGRLAACHVMGTTAIARVLAAGADIIDHGHYLTDELANDAAKRGVYLTPTLSSYDVETMHSRFDRGRDWGQLHGSLIPGHKSAIAAALRAGLRLLVGTDSCGSYAEEVALMRDAGVAPVDTLRACTSWAAQALRLGAEVGSIAVGKRGDLVILNRDPLEDAYALEDVEVVVKDGQVYSPEALLYAESVHVSGLLQLAQAEQ